MQSAKGLFDGSGITVIADGDRYLGAGIGTRTHIEQYVKNKISEFIGEVKTLSAFAFTQPHAAYSAFCHGLIGKWTYLARIIPHSSELFISLEDAIQTIFLSSLTGQSPFNDTDRNMLALPTRLGGLGIINPSQMSSHHYTTSGNVTPALANLVITRATLMTPDLGI